MQDDYHFLRVCRYVEANAVRAKRVPSAEQWQWGGLWRRRQHQRDLALAAWPQERPRHWLALVNAAMDKEDLQAIQVCAQRGRPYGASDWVAGTAVRLGLEFTLRNPGRPRKSSGNE